MYDASKPNRGNSNYNEANRDNEDIYFTLNWDNARDMGKVDLRLFYIESDNETKAKFTDDAW